METKTLCQEIFKEAMIVKWKEILLNQLNHAVRCICSYNVASIDDTLQELMDTEKPLIRFGDGEMRIIYGGACRLSGI